MRERRRPLLALLGILAVSACTAPAADAAAARKGYVTSVVGGSVLPFDAVSGVAGTPIPFSGRPWGVAITPDGATAYVADLGSADVTPIDLATRTAGTPIAVGSGPHGIAIAPDGSRVYVSDIFSGDVRVIDTATNLVVATIPAGSDPYTIAITPDGATVYVTNIASSDVYAIDTSTDTATAIPVGGGTFGVAVAPDGATAYVSRSGTSSLVPIDTATNAVGTPIQIGSSPEGIAITPDGRTAYVTDVGSGVDALWSLDLASGTVGASTSVAQAPIGIAITPDRAPTAAFATSVAGLAATLDGSAASDPDGTIARYAWSFGDGQTATGSQPIVSHSYAQPGSYTATLTVTDDEGCSVALVFTGQTASCTGSPAARVAHTVTVAAPPTPSAPTPPAPAPRPLRQAIERFTLDSRCVRLARDGMARIGLRLLLAKPGSVEVQVDRAVAATNGTICPKPDPRRHYTGALRRVAALENLATQPAAVAAAVRRRLTRSFELRPGLYRIGVRAYDSGGRLTRTAYRWVRVLTRHARS
jgi:YVTN family beta-propeller protein